MATSRKRYAVVSCHVERLLDDRVWEAFSRLQERRPGGFAVAALVRPPAVDAGEDEQRWLERARLAAERGPFGHHAHWTSPTHARPTGGEEPGARVVREGRWLRDNGLAATLFCGGGWYTDRSVMEACATLGYADCTARATRPGYLAGGERWAQLGTPARVRLPAGQLVTSVPTTRTVGDLARVVVRPAGPQEEVVHVYLHDTDLLDRRRTAALHAGLAVLARRSTATDLDAVSSAAGSAPEVAWTEIARGEGAEVPE